MRREKRVLFGDVERTRCKDKKLEVIKITSRLLKDVYGIEINKQRRKQHKKVEYIYKLILNKEILKIYKNINTKSILDD